MHDDIRFSRLRRTAQYRLTKWAIMVRMLSYHGAPHPTCYSKEPFIDGRIDHETIGRWIDADEWYVAALETDAVLQQLRGSEPIAYEAVVVRYLEREPGTSRPLHKDSQVAIWWRRTGLGRRQYYRRIMQAERYVGGALGT